MINILLNDKSAFEIVRDKVAIIVYNEMINQRNLSAPAGALPNAEYFEFISKFFKSNIVGDMLPNIFVERFTRLNTSELNALNIYYDRSTLSKGTQISNQRSDSRFQIDFFVAHKGTEDSKGDSLAAKDLHKIMGVVRNIIMHTIYITLGFSKPFIQRRWIKELNAYKPNENENKVNVDNIITGNLSLSVEFDEKNLGVIAEELEENYTTVSVDEAARFSIETENLFTS